MLSSEWSDRHGLFGSGWYKLLTVKELLLGTLIGALIGLAALNATITHMWQSLRAHGGWAGMIGDRDE